MDKSSVAGLPAEFTLFVQREVVIDAPAAVVFDAILEEAGPGLVDQDGKSLNLRLAPPQPRHDVVHRHLAPRQHLQQLPPLRLGDRIKRIQRGRSSGHAVNSMPIWA